MGLSLVYLTLSKPGYFVFFTPEEKEIYAQYYTLYLPVS